MPFLTNLIKPILLPTRVLQWVSAVIVMGFYSYFVHKQHSGVHIIFNEVIAVTSVVFFLPAFISPFRSTFSKFVVMIDFIYSYLWLTAFIFAAQSYDTGDVRLAEPSGVKKSVKHAAEAFTFLAFFFTIMGFAYETATHWVDSTESNTPVREKHGDTRAPLDAPADTTGPAAV